MTLSVFAAARPVVAPGKEGVVYYPSMGLQVSTDNGKTFTRLDSLAACMAVGLGKGKTDSYPYTIFVWGKPTNDDSIGLYWSEDEGKTWSKVSDDQHQFGGLGGVHARGGFVEEQKARICGESADDLKSALSAVRKRAGFPVVHIVHADNGKKLHRLFVRLLLLFPDTRHISSPTVPPDGKSHPYPSAPAS